MACSLNSDTFITGGGTDVFVLAGPTTDTAIAGGFTHSAAIPANGTAIATGGMDVITGFAAGMTIFTGQTFVANPLVRNGGAMDTGTLTTTQKQALVTGSYSSAANTFTLSLAGTDSMYVYDANGTTVAGSLHGIVLVGYVDQLQNDTITAINGIFTAVAG
jgi:hypothetical protein